MAIVSLLVLPSRGTFARNAFNFDHAMLHRSMQRRLKTPSGLPVIIDPMQDEGLPGSKWHFDHQSAHEEFSSSQILSDSNLDNPGQAAWWTFVNHQQHRLTAKPGSTSG